MSRSNSHGSASFRLLVALATWLAPLAATAQQSGPATAADRLLTSRTVAAVQLRPGRLLRSPLVTYLPTEVATAAGLQYVGLDPLKLDRVEVAIEPPYGTRMNYAMSFEFSDPISLTDLKDEITSKLIEAEGWPGRVVYATEEADPNAPYITQVDERTVLVASMAMLRSLLDADREPANGPFADWLAERDTEVDFHAAVHFGPLRGLANMGIAAALPKAREEMEPQAYELVEQLSKAPDEIEYVEAWGDLSERGQAGVAVEARDGASADRLADCLTAVRRSNLAAFEQAAEQLDATDPTQSAMADYLRRIGPVYANAVQPTREGVRFYRVVPEEGPTNHLSLVLAQTAVIGVLVALLLPAVQAAREAARRNQSLQNVKLILLALHRYHDKYDKFPPRAIVSAKGKPLLSWRVAILPYLDQQALYERFALDEPWDSATNRPLLAEMPDVYADPSGTLEEGSGKTHYLGVVGDRAFFTGSFRRRSFFDIVDGTSNTLAVVQVDDSNAVEWTRPADYDADVNREDPVAGIGALHPSVFLGGFADGAAKAVDLDTDPDTLRAWFTVNGREPIATP